MHVESMQPGRRKDRGVHDALVDLLHSRRDVASQLHDLQIIAKREELRPTPQARCADASPSWQLGELRGSDIVVHDEHVTRILPGQKRADFEPIGICRRKILEGMDATLHLPAGEVVLQLLREESLRADLGEWLRQVLVTDCLIGDELRSNTGFLDQSRDHACLPQRQLGGSGRDADDLRSRHDDRKMPDVDPRCLPSTNQPMTTPHVPSLNDTLSHPRFNPSAPKPVATATPQARLDAIDILRGIVMIIMMIDHTRDFVNAQGYQFDPTDVTKTTGALFFVRWITHFCAPLFV